ncbi:hypothetical protein SPRG_01913 [Saprolegnia parasitica CBS 223.65]|uniref:Peptidase A1 domain-containing protein n=1 Tax=Saprolegnia parasitica (strain CBS 223.65) TaxID=695850 RepID=A0A067D2Y0_SAPPC|nr:hypothetical protein SPRG_01913 [Saprolegnia parasitica CBS 223.65]KDO33101.1 hypothetical protein SPRG_01913 [Saprolegnia parasitica CBS 223.65]|eukprot:XP_012195869.1 hypothetical protein SPRG_01913 [Saprolegnia parasitica CBS 223.65]
MHALRAFCCASLVAASAATSFYRQELPMHRRLATSSVELINHGSTQYLVNVAIEGKSYTVQIDTGSADLWVTCDYISSSACVSPCPSTAITITYGSGSACVVPQNGSVVIGSVAVSNGVYGIAMTSSLPTNVSQGILGLAFPGLSSYRSLANTSSYAVFHLDSFSMYLTPQADAPGSKLVLNGVDDAMVAKDNLVGYTIPLATGEQDYWNINVSQFSVEGGSVPWNLKPCKNGGCLAIVDSGTSFLAMPKAVFQPFVATYLLPHNCVFRGDYYTCPSTIALPRLAFAFGDSATLFYLNPWDYSLVFSPTEIIVQLQATPSGRLVDRWIIGDTFLKVYYTTYKVSEKAVVFYCKSGNCAGGDNLLDFSAGMPTWALILIIAGGCLVGLGLLGLVAWCHYYRRRTGASKRPCQSVWVVDDNSSSEETGASHAYGAATR